MHATYRVSIVVLPDGERLPLLVDGKSGIPFIDPNAFAISQMRGSAKAANTIEVALRSISVLLALSVRRRFDLTERIRSGELLSPSELDLLVEAARSRMEHLSCEVIQTPAALLARHYSQQALEKLRFPVPADESPLVSARSARLRLHYIYKYLRWLTERRQHQLRGTSEFLAYRAASELLLRGLATRFPPKPRVISAVRGLTQEAESKLAQLVALDCRDNPWPDPTVRIRNQLLLLTLLLLGSRGGEVRGILIPDVDGLQSRLNIFRRPHPPNDPRRRPAQAKTLPRFHHLDRSLLDALMHYVLNVRQDFEGALHHDFLFVAHPSGRPLSKSALAKIFEPLNGHPLIGERVTPHVLRHTWNDRDTEACVAAGVDESLARRTREWLQGWVRGSPSSDLYNQRSIETIGMERQKLLQKAMLGRHA